MAGQTQAFLGRSIQRDRIMRGMVSCAPMATQQKSGAARYDGVLALLVDGARPDLLAKLAAEGELPCFKRHFIDRGGFRSATSVFPTVSGPAHLPLLTGLHPGAANIPGIRWAEKPGRLGFLGHTRSYMSLFRPSKLSRDLGPDVRTLFQHVPRVADINTWFVRGSGFWARRTRFSKAASFVSSLATKDWYASDRQAEGALRGALKAGYLSAFVVFPSIDELGHRFGPLSDQSIEAYRRFDAALGRIMDQLTRLKTYDRTLVLVTSDHGQSSTHTHFELSKFVGDRIPKTLAYPKFWKHAMSAEAVVMVSGNSMANIYLRPAQGWAHPLEVQSDPRAQELLGALLEQSSVEHVIFRGGAGRFVVKSAAGRCEIDIDVENATASQSPQPTLSWQSQGLGPLDCARTQAPLTAEGVLEHTIDSQYPDAPWQIAQFFRSARAGDLIVCAKNGFDLRDKYEYQPHLGSHGALDREHMMVPAAINAAWGADRIRSVDLFPTMLQELGLTVPSGLSGVARPVA